MSRPTRSQLRRHARRLSRDGYQPMMLINSGTDLPETAATAIVRAIWRYRSELAPLTTAGLTWVTAWVCHATHTAWWPALAGATAARTISSAFLSSGQWALTMSAGYSVGSARARSSAATPLIRASAPRRRTAPSPDSWWTPRRPSSYRAPRRPCAAPTTSAR